MAGFSSAGPAGGGGLAKLAETIVSSPVATITFSSIPQTYSHLRIIGAGRCTGAVVADGLYLQYNGDTAANYSRQFYQASGVAAAGNSTLSASHGNVLGVLTGASTLANAFASVTIEIPGYSSTSMCKQAHATCGIVNGATVSGIAIFIHSAIWVNTAAITSIVLAPDGGSNFAVGTIFTLYGI